MRSLRIPLHIFLLGKSHCSYGHFFEKNAHESSEKCPNRKHKYQQFYMGVVSFFLLQNHAALIWEGGGHILIKYLSHFVGFSVLKSDNITNLGIAMFVQIFPISRHFFKRHEICRTAEIFLSSCTLREKISIHFCENIVSFH